MLRNFLIKLNFYICSIIINILILFNLRNFSDSWWHHFRLEKPLQSYRGHWTIPRRMKRCQIHGVPFKMPKCASSTFPITCLPCWDLFYQHLTVLCTPKFEPLWAFQTKLSGSVDEKFAPAETKKAGFSLPVRKQSGHVKVYRSMCIMQCLLWWCVLDYTGFAQNWWKHWVLHWIATEHQS